MTNTIYTVTLADGQKFQMEANLAEASAPIRANFHSEEDTWDITPYQTADAEHNPMRAAELCAEYFSTGEDDCTEVESVE